MQSGFNYFPSDVNLQDEKGNTALYYLAKNGQMEFIEWMFSK